MSLNKSQFIFQKEKPIDQSQFYQQPKKQYVIVSAKQSVNLSNYEFEVILKERIRNVVGMKVKNFAILDDGSKLPLPSNSSILLLFSNLGSGVVNSSFRCGTSLDQENMSALQYSNIIGWNFSGRASPTSTYPLFVSDRSSPKLQFSSPKDIFNFSLGFSTLVGNIPTQSNPYILQAVIKFYTEC